jgi:hypothetical protein
MADPFLLAHQVAESVFDIGGKLYPVSIRDQMVRGQSIIDRAVAEGFAATGRELLVIGAGAAGAVAAMRAAAWNIRTHIIDADAKPFGRQRSCRTRWLDPHEYEWPANHWKNQFYPYDVPPHPYYGFPVPLPWQAQWADALAFGWSARFTTAYSTIPHLTFYPATTLAPLPPPAFNVGTNQTSIGRRMGVASTWSNPQNGLQLLCPQSQLTVHGRNPSRAIRAHTISTIAIQTSEPIRFAPRVGSGSGTSGRSRSMVLHPRPLGSA